MDLTKDKKIEVDSAEKEEQAVDLAEELQKEMMPILVNFPGMTGGESSSEESSIILYGDIDEDNSADVVVNLLKKRSPKNTESDESPAPITLYLSSFGGSAADMFAVYDVMRMVRKDREIHTFGLGKVMSAGVVLLAGGTKGKRKIGRNCRIMIHGVISGYHGHLHNLANEMEEARWIQEKYIDALVSETDMTKRYIKKLIDRKVNVYLDAKEAVELGIADEII